MKLKIRIRPAEGEALAGFLQRVATANGRSLFSIYPYIKSARKKSLKQDDILRLDCTPDSIIDWNKAKQFIGVNKEDLLKLSLVPLLRNFAGEEELSSTKILRNVLRKSYAFCPDCLKSKGIRQLLWSFQPIQFCCEHDRMLLEKCPHCSRSIKLVHLQECRVCPYCNGSLLIDLNFSAVVTHIEYQRFISNAIKELCNVNSPKLHDAKEVATKLIYILNGSSNNFVFENVKEITGSAAKAHWLLRQARGTASRKTHLLQQLNILFRYKVSVHKFLNFNVPESFVSQLQGSRKEKQGESVYCVAPWCDSYKKPSAILFNRSKAKKHSEFMGKYFVCFDCGCEYAINKKGEIIERTRYIAFYKSILSQEAQESQKHRIELNTGMTWWSRKRMIAYFSNRGLLGYTPCDIEQPLLAKTLSALSGNESVQSIQRWSCWESTEHFLQYLTHPKVVRITVDRTIQQPFRKYKLDIINQIESICRTMISENTLITIEKVSKKLKVNSTTLRSWGFVDIIKKFIHEQRGLITQKNINEWKRGVEQFLNEENTDILSADVYKFLGIKPSFIRAKAPELITHIQELRREVRFSQKKFNS